MRPTPGDVHVNRPLTDMSVAVFQAATNFVATSAFPTVPSDNQSNSYFIFDERYFNRDGMKLRGPGAEAETLDYKLSTASFNCKQYAGKHMIPDQVRANADKPLDQDRQAMALVMNQVLIKKEKLWVNSFFKSGVWTAYDWAGVVSGPTGNQVLQWNDANAKPLDDVEAASLSMLSKTGYRPNKFIVGAQVHSKLKNHPTILARVNAGQTPGGPAMVTKQMLASLFEVDEYLVMNSIEETSAEDATAATSFIGGKKALLVYAPSSPGLMVPSAGYNFAWTGYLGATQEGYRIKKYREEPKASDTVEAELSIDPKLISVNLGAFFDTIVA